MSLALIGAGISALGGIFGGRSRKKAAKKAAAQAQQMQNQVNAAADAAVAQTSADQFAALELRAQDEARLKAATGYDMIKLRDDATAAGFNPLTVLQATGGAGYDGRGAVMVSPFIGRSDSMMAKASLMSAGMGVQAQAQGGVVQASGYFGDALSGLGNSLFDIGAAGAQRNHEMAMQTAAMRGSTSSLGASGGTVSTARRGATAPLVGAKTISASPGRYYGPDPLVSVRTSLGWRKIDPGAAKRLGVGPGDWLMASDYEDLLGEIPGAVAGGADAILGKGPFFGKQAAPGVVVPPSQFMQPEVQIWGGA